MDFLHGKAAIFIGVHRLEDALVGRLKFLQGDGPVTVAVHHGKEHPHHHAAMHPPGTSHHAPSAHHPHSWTPAPAPTRPVVPTHHPTIVFDIIVNSAARSLGACSWRSCSDCCCWICGCGCVVGPCWAPAQIAPHARRKADVVSNRTRFSILNLHTLKLRGRPMRTTAERRQAQ